MKRNILPIVVIILLVSVGFYFFNKNQTNVSVVPSSNSASQTTPYPSQNNATISGVFEGRTPCGSLVRVVNNISENNCERVKIRLTLFQDEKAHNSTTFQLEMIYVGKGDTRYEHTGNWIVKEGIKTNLAATVYQLNIDNSNHSLSFYKVDDNILLFLDRELNLLVGTAGESYTLSRTDKGNN